MNQVWLPLRYEELVLQLFGFHNTFERLMTYCNRTGLLWKDIDSFRTFVASIRKERLWLYIMDYVWCSWEIVLLVYNWSLNSHEAYFLRWHSNTELLSNWNGDLLCHSGQTYILWLFLGHFKQKYTQWETSLLDLSENWNLNQLLGHNFWFNWKYSRDTLVDKCCIQQLVYSQAFNTSKQFANFRVSH